MTLESYVVFHGNCQAYALGKLYQLFFAVPRHQRVIILEEGGVKAHDAEAIVERLRGSRVTYVEQVMDWPREGALYDELKSMAGLRRYTFPMLTGWFLWPYSGEPHPKNSDFDGPGEGPYPAEYGDAFLNKMIAEGVPTGEAVKRYLDLDIGLVGGLDRRLEIGLDRQRRRDAITDFAIAGFIENNFRQVPLFSTRGHPTHNLFKHIAAPLFLKMGVALDEVVTALSHEEHGLFPKTQVPIHPNTLSHFSIEYASGFTRYNYLIEGKFTFQEYSKRYMEFDFNIPLYFIWRKGPGHLSEEQLCALEAVLASPPPSPEAHRVLAENFWHRGDKMRALELARRSCSLDQADPTSLVLLSKYLLNLGYADEALSSARQATLAQPFWDIGYRAVADAYLASDHNDKAIKALQIATKLMPAASSHLALLGKCLIRAGDLAGARSALEQAASVAENQDSDTHAIQEARSMLASLSKNNNVRDRVFFMEASRPANYVRHLRQGWSHPENGFVWALDEFSQIAFDGFKGGESTIVFVECFPYRSPVEHPEQSLEILAGERYSATFSVNRHATYCLRTGPDLAEAPWIRLRHPNGVVPASIEGSKSKDPRCLSIALKTVLIAPESDVPEVQSIQGSDFVLVVETYHKIRDRLFDAHLEQKTA